jgi:hypothetical protein
MFLSFFLSADVPVELPHFLIVRMRRQAFHSLASVNIA